MFGFSVHTTLASIYSVGSFSENRITFSKQDQVALGVFHFFPPTVFMDHDWRISVLEL